MKYMWREASALFVVAYAFVLLSGIIALARGEAAWQTWLLALRSPYSYFFHAVTLAFMIFHAWTWFDIMPKTMPPIVIRRWVVPQIIITRAGQAAMIVATLLVLFLAWSL